LVKTGFAGDVGWVMKMSSAVLGAVAAQRHVHGRVDDRHNVIVESHAAASRGAA
jgi:hypothetical protein